MEDLNLLRSATNKVESFTLDGLTVIGKCVDVYDGDSIKVVIYYPMINNDGTFEKKLVKFTIRMLGYDSPEIRSKDPKEKEAALEAKKRLIQLTNLNNFGLIKIVFSKNDKYGRFLATVYEYQPIFSPNNKNLIIGGNASFKSINDIMIEEKHGYPYFGGKKVRFDAKSSN